MLRDLLPVSLLIVCAASICHAAPDFNISAYRVFKTPGIRLDATCLAEKSPDFVWAEIRDLTGTKTLRSSKLSFPDGQLSASLTWPDKGLAPGRYWVVIWDSGRLEILKSTYLDIAPAPDWIGNKAGAFDDNWVPKPWTPLQLVSSDPVKVACWGRQYTLNASGLVSVQSQGAELLASPMTWKATVSGRALDWKAESTTVGVKARGAIEFISSQTAEGLRLVCKGRVEFDGFVKLAFELRSTGAPVTVDGLCVDIPYNAKHATLTHYFPKVPVWYGGVGIDGINAGSAPSKAWGSVWLPHVWLGDEDRGLQWLSESDEGWRPADPAKAIEIIPAAGRSTNLRLNLIGRPTLVDKPLEYTFAFEASPVKPVPADKYTWHYAHFGGCTDIKKNADRIKDLGVTTVDTLTWTELWGYPRPATQENIDLLRSTLDAVHQRGMDMIVYNAYLLSDAAPEYATLGKECRIVDEHAYVCPGWMHDTVYAVCQNSVWADYMVSSIDENVRKYNLRGVYSDSMTCIGTCSNRLHGCGYVGEDGKVYPTVEIFAVRDFMKRVYRALELRGKEIGKEMKFVGHTSANVMLPTLAFCSAYLDTEHLTPMARPFRIPLDVFRAEFMGRNFGVPALTLSYYTQNGGKGLTEQEMLAISLLHDAEVPWSLDAQAPVWKVWDSFGMENTQFLPYWKAWGWQAPDGMKVSAYSKTGSNEMLVVAANLSEQEVRGTLGLQRPIESAVDALTGKPVAVENGAITDTFPVWQARMYRVLLIP